MNAETLRPVWRRSLLWQQIQWQWLVFPTALFLCTRIALVGFAKIALFLMPSLWTKGGLQDFVPGFPTLDAFCRWDCAHFERIARAGYQRPNDTNFFPLFPLLARIVRVLTTMNLHVAMILVPNAACLGALIIIYRIFATLEGVDAARWGLALFAAYPFAFFQATAYPESLMICFSALAILLALRGNHIWAGVALSFGVLARHLTMFAGAGLLTAQLRQRGVHLRRFLWSPAILGLAIPWLGLGLCCLYQYISFNDALAFWHARAAWGAKAWWGLPALLAAKQRSVDVKVMFTYLPFALFTTLGTVALLTKRRWIELASFAVVLMGMLWVVGMWGLGRYSASCWPAFLPCGVWLARHPNWQSPVLGILILFQGLFFYLFIHQFPIL
jgi:hypothetical protein